MSSSTEAVRIEPATTADVPVILRFIEELADYERLAHEMVATESALADALFGPERAAHALVARVGREPAGFALYFFNFSTFLAKRGLYLEDLYVTPAWRRCGIGRQLLARLAAIAVERGCGRMEWSVLDWNAQALAVYRAIGARPMSEWTVQRLTGADLEALAAEAPAAPPSSGR